MKLYSIIFGSQYEKLADVLEFSAKKNSPQTPLTIYEILDRDDEIRILGRRVRSTFRDNARKAKHFLEIVREAKQGELLGLLDVDTMILQDLSLVQRYDFDLAVTYRPKDFTYPFSTGVLFLRKSPKIEQFFEKWYEISLDLLSDEKRLDEAYKLYGGVNQAGLAYTLEEIQIKVKRLGCKHWNLIPGLWSSFSPTKTRVVHIAGTLRNSILHGERPSSSSVRRLVEIWKGLNNERKKLLEKDESSS